MKGINFSRKLLKINSSGFIVFYLSIFSVFGQQMSEMKMDTSVPKTEEMKAGHPTMMLPMPFFTHMGIPYGVGTYALNAAILPTIKGGIEYTQVNFQFMTGLSNIVGLLIGGEELIDEPTLEAMFQFLVWKSKNGMHGFSPIIEFEFPLDEKATRSVLTLVGFSFTFSNSHIAFNQVLHYSPLEYLAEGSFSLLGKVSNRIFLVTEISGVIENNAQPIINLLGGLKIQLTKNFLLGFAFQFPLTNNRNYSSRYVFQPNLLFSK